MGNEREKREKRKGRKKGNGEVMKNSRGGENNGEVVVGSEGDETSHRKRIGGRGGFCIAVTRARRVNAPRVVTEAERRT